ncbi:MAG: NAD(P)/FAD-dependent oxidoreductase [Prolixibacteraceae bacterium]
MEKKDQLLSINIPESHKPRVVIVGGGFGGIHLLSGLKDDFQIVLIDRYNYHTFQPLLYQVATAGLEPDSVAEPFRKMIGRNRDVCFRMVKVDRVDPEAQHIYTTAGSLSYDYLVIATGSQTNFFDNPNIAKNAFPLKQVTHALDLRSHIFQQFEKSEMIADEQVRKRLMTFVVVGAGPTGVEISGALAELKNHILPHDYPQLDVNRMRIFLVEGLERVLPAMSAVSGGRTQKYLERMGVEIILSDLILDYDGKTVRLRNGGEIETDTLIWAAGVNGNLPDGFGEKSIFRGKLAVSETCQVYRDQKTRDVFNNVFAIGDVASMSAEDGKGTLPGLAQVAIQQGRQLAANLLRINRGEPVRAFRYRDKGVLATIGRNKAVAEFPGKICLTGWSGWLVWLIVHLWFLIGFRNKAVVFANWVWSYVTYDRGIRLIIRPSTKSTDPVSREMTGEMREDI